METPNFDSLPLDVQRINTKLDRLEIILSEILKAKEQRTTWFSVREVADYLKLSVPTIYGLTSNRKIPFAKRNKKLYFLKENIDKWLSSGRKRVIPGDDF